MRVSAIFSTNLFFHQDLGILSLKEGSDGNELGTRSRCSGEGQASLRPAWGRGSGAQARKDHLLMTFNLERACY